MLTALEDVDCWVPLEHSCGHLVQWGFGETARVTGTMQVFIVAAVISPCPWCGSGTGVPTDCPDIGVCIYLAAHDVWYERVSDPGRKEDARLNRIDALESVEMYIRAGYLPDSVRGPAKPPEREPT